MTIQRPLDERVDELAESLRYIGAEIDRLVRVLDVADVMARELLAEASGQPEQEVAQAAFEQITQWRVDASRLGGRVLVRGATP